VLAELLPDGLVAVETRADVIDFELFPEERSALGNAVEKRRREFTTGRACARSALERLGIPPVPIARGPRGAPVWPPGVIGSITHCDGYRACAAGRIGELRSVGIDAELHDELPEGVLAAISSARERRMLDGLHLDGHADRLLFSAKESVYKAWFPLTRRWLEFKDVDLSIAASDASFRARLLVPGPTVAGRRLTELHGRWRIEDDLIGAVVVV
jgi:4'-phosphopantetheinyl transferase EntD